MWYICIFSLQGRDGTPLVVASVKGLTEVANLLLQAEGIDVNKGVRRNLPLTIPLLYYSITSHFVWYSTLSRQPRSMVTSR